MTTSLTHNEAPLTMKGFFSQDNVKAKFAEILGQRSNAFVTSVLSTVTQNKMLAKVDPQSIYMAAMTAAVLDLPINPSLGMAYIVPYGTSAQFQLGYKGLIQLCVRSGQFKTIDTKVVYEGQLIQSDNSFGSFEFHWSKKTSDKVIGYAAHFLLLTGFEKTFYMSLEEITAHGKRFSKTFNNGPWKTDFDAMACKTVLKLLLDKYAPKSIEMQKAQIVDQAIIKDVETLDVEYTDNGHATPDYEAMKTQIEEMMFTDGLILTEKEQKRYGEILETEETESYEKVINELNDKLSKIATT